MTTLRDYAINGNHKYWPIIQDGYKDNRKVWTLTVHEATCRFAKTGHGTSTPYHAYFGESGLYQLAEYGFAAPTTRFARTVWQGCKVCGTVSLDAKALALEAIDAKRRAQAIEQERFVEEHAKHNAKVDRDHAIGSAVDTWLYHHAAEIEEVKAQAAATWDSRNPERAALLD